MNPNQRLQQPPVGQMQNMSLNARGPPVTQQQQQRPGMPPGQPYPRQAGQFQPAPQQQRPPTAPGAGSRQPRGVPQSQPPAVQPPQQGNAGRMAPQQYRPPSAAGPSQQPKAYSQPPARGYAQPPPQQRMPQQRLPQPQQGMPQQRMPQQAVPRAPAPRPQVAQMPPAQARGPPQARPAFAGSQATAPPAPRAPVAQMPAAPRPSMARPPQQLQQQHLQQPQQQARPPMMMMNAPPGRGTPPQMPGQFARGPGQMAMRPPPTQQQQQQQQQQPQAPGMHQGMGGQRQQNLATTNIDPSCQCPPTYFATTVGKFPNSSTLANQAGVPIGAIVQPLAESDDPADEIPVVNYGSVGIVRCKRCRAYMNPFVQWHENGRRWGCNVCGCMNDTNSQYYKHLDANGDRVDKHERAELSKGIIEIVAPGEYCVRPPQPPVYVFVLDVSQEAVRSGMVKAAVETIKQTLDELPGAPRTQVGFITYDIAVHFYNLKASLSQPQMLVVSDIQELFLPIPEELLVNLAESRAMVDSLLDSLPEMHAENSVIETAFGPAIQAAFTVMSHIGGKMCVFQTKLPTIGAGKLDFRNNPRVLGSDKEHALLAPATAFYKTKALEFSRMQVAVELFLLPAAYCDVATLNNLPKFTGGQLHYYPRFNAERDGEALREDIRRTLTRTTAWEAVLRIRASRGIRVTNFYGNFFLRGVDLLALPNCDADSTFGVEFLHEEKMVASGAVSIQMALLYTNSNGERRIRVSTNCLPVTSHLPQLLESVRQDDVCNLLAKQMAENAVKLGFDDSRRKITEACVSVLKAARSGGSYQGQIPPSLKFFPLYTMSLQKNISFRGGQDVGVDERAAILHTFGRMSTPISKVFIYPRMYELHTMTPDCGRLVAIPDDAPADPSMLIVGNQRLKAPALVNLSATCLNSQGAYLLDNGVSLLMWLGRALAPDFLRALFGVESLEGIDSGVLRLVPTSSDNDLKRRICNVVQGIRNSHVGKFQILHFIKEGEPVEQRFRMYLVEDRAPFPGGSFAYQEYLNHVTNLAQGGGYASRRR